MDTTPEPKDGGCYGPCDIKSHDKEMVFIISSTLAGISLLGSLAVIIHIIYKRRYYTFEVRPSLHSSLANAGFCASLITLATIYLTTKENIRETFVVLTALEEIFYLATFFLTANHAVVIYIQLKDKQSELDKQKSFKTLPYVRRGLKLVYILAWAIPPALLIPMTIIVLLHPHNADIYLCLICPSVTYCSSSTKGIAFSSVFLSNFGSTLVIATYCAISLAIWVLYGLSRSHCNHILKRNDLHDSDKDFVRWLRQRLILYMFCFYYCWTPTFIIALLALIYGLLGAASPNCVFLFYIWATTAPTQGILLTIIYFFSEYCQSSRNRRNLVPFGSSGPIRYYGSGNHRSRYQSRTPSPFPTIKETEDSSAISDNDEIVSRSSKSAFRHPSLSPSYRTKRRSPSFMQIIRDTDTESEVDTGHE